MEMLNNLFRLPAIAAVCLFPLPVSAREERVSLISGSDGMDNFTIVGDGPKPQISNRPADLDRHGGAGMTAGILDFAQIPGGDGAAEVS